MKLVKKMFITVASLCMIHQPVLAVGIGEMSKSEKAEKLKLYEKTVKAQNAYLHLTFKDFLDLYETPEDKAYMKNIVDFLNLNNVNIPELKMNNGQVSFVFAGITTTIKPENFERGYIYIEGEEYKVDWEASAEERMLKLRDDIFNKLSKTQNKKLSSVFLNFLFPEANAFEWPLIGGKFGFNWQTLVGVGVVAMGVFSIWKSIKRKKLSIWHPFSCKGRAFSDSGYEKCDEDDNVNDGGGDGGGEAATSAGGGGSSGQEQ